MEGPQGQRRQIKSWRKVTAGTETSTVAPFARLVLQLRLSPHLFEGFRIFHFQVYGKLPPLPSAPSPSCIRICKVLRLRYGVVLLSRPISHVPFPCPSFSKFSILGHPLSYPRVSFFLTVFVQMPEYLAWGHNAEEARDPMPMELIMGNCPPIPYWHSSSFAFLPSFPHPFVPPPPPLHPVSFRSPTPQSLIIPIPSARPPFTRPPTIVGLLPGHPFSAGGFLPQSAVVTLPVPPLKPQAIGSHSASIASMVPPTPSHPFWH